LNYLWLLYIWMSSLPLQHPTPFPCKKNSLLNFLANHILHSKTRIFTYSNVNTKNNLYVQFYHQISLLIMIRSILSGAIETNVRFEVSTAVTMKNGVFWDVMPCGSCKNRRFEGT
jgi:hypothetical protein